MSLLLPSVYIVGYVRVSKAEQGNGWSPTNQEAAIRRFAEQHHLAVAGIYHDIGRSGASLRNRHGLLNLLRTVKEGGIGAVVAWREDRLGRRMRDGFALSREIHATGAHIICLEPFLHDPGPAHGTSDANLLRPILQIQAQEEWETIRRRVVPGLKSAAIRGRRGGHTPFGYRRIDAQTLVIEPSEAAIVRRCFSAVASGTRVSALVRQLATEGVRHSDGASLTFDLINGFLGNAFMCGTLLYRLPTGVEGAGQVIRHDGHHPAIIDHALFAKVGEVLRQRRERVVSWRGAAGDSEGHSSAPSPLTAAAPSAAPSRVLDVMAAITGPARPVHGIIPPAVARCGNCGAPMYASLQTCGARGRRRRVPVYLCHRHKKEGNAICPQPPAEAVVIDAAIARRLRTAITSGRFRDHLQPSLPPDVGDLDARIAAVTKSHAAMQQAVALGAGSAVLYERVKALASKLELLTSERQRRAQTLRLPSGPRWAVVQDFDRAWPACDAATQRDIIGWLVADVRIQDKQVRSIRFAEPIASQEAG